MSKLILCFLSAIHSNDIVKPVSYSPQGIMKVNGTSHEIWNSNLNEEAQC
jgi:hypothetical protein